MPNAGNNQSLTPVKNGLNERSETFDFKKQTLGDRLRDARKAGGLTQVQVSKLMDIPQSSITRYESNEYEAGKIYIEKLAEITKTNPAWISHGEGTIKQGGLPILGYVGAGAEVYPIDDHAQGDADEFINPPFQAPRGAVALKIKGDSMTPQMENGDIVIYSRTAPFILEDCLNRRCVVHIETGRLLVKKIIQGDEFRRFNLLSSNANPIKNVKILWAAPILGIVYR